MDRTLSRLEAVKSLRKLHVTLELNEHSFISASEGGNFYHHTSESSNGDSEQKKITWLKCLKLISGWFERYPLVYVNAYDVRQAYGGPEEGGWWYDYGKVLASVPVRKRGNNVEETIENLNKEFKEEYDAMRERSSAAGGADLLICIEKGVAAQFPDKIPHYE